MGLFLFFRNNGKLWNLQQKKGNNYQELELFGKEKAEFFFTQLISPPASKVACLDFRFKKFSAGGKEPNVCTLTFDYLS